MFQADKIKYYVYIDYTTKGNPEPYYIGKGNDNRLTCLERNERHDYRMRHLGLTREVVYETFDEKHAFEVEKSLIKELHTFIHDPLCTIGTNYTEGGEGCSGLRHTEETKQIIREKRAKQQILENNIPVAQYDSEGNLIKIFRSIMEAINITGITNIIGAAHDFNSTSKTNIGNLRRHGAGGFRWVRIEDINNVPQKIEAASLEQNFHSHGVIQYDLNGKEIARFDSIYEASQTSGCSGGSIADYCKNRKTISQSKTFFWQYIDTEKTIVKTGTIRGVPQPVAQYDENDNLIAVYKSAKEAYKITGISSILDRCRGKVKNNLQYKWKFYVHEQPECVNIKSSKVTE